jgi:predicted SprT family Zn-dependent metalloprotease
MYDLERITKEFHEACEKAGHPCTIPIYINSRLSSTLARVDSNSKQGYVTPMRAYFSKAFIENGTDEDVRQVLLHEAAHYIVIMRTHTFHGHDEYFKAVCHEIGCKNDGATYQTEKIETGENMYKYAIYCPNCGYITSRARMCSVLRNIDRYTCPDCGAPLYYEEKW